LATEFSGGAVDFGIFSHMLSKAEALCSVMISLSLGATVEQWLELNLS
jgi:hypothetical protein